MAQLTRLYRWMLSGELTPVLSSTLDGLRMASSCDGPSTKLYTSLASSHQSDTRCQGVDRCGLLGPSPWHPYTPSSRLQAAVPLQLHSMMCSPLVSLSGMATCNTQDSASWNVRTVHTGSTAHAQDRAHLLEVSKHAQHKAMSSHKAAAVPSIPGVPRVLLRDPWPALDARERKGQALIACLEVLRAAGPDAALPAEQVYEQVCSQPQHQDLLGSPGETRQLLEHLRDKRLIYGRTHLQAEVPAGHPNYPYLYTALPYQKMFKGSPAAEARRVAALQQRRMASALRKLRSGKTPFAIHRQVARSSVYQQALAYEQARQAQHLLGAAPRL